MLAVIRAACYGNPSKSCQRMLLVSSNGSGSYFCLSYTLQGKCSQTDPHPAGMAVFCSPEHTFSIPSSVNCCVSKGKALWDGLANVFYLNSLYVNVLGSVKLYLHSDFSPGLNSVCSHFSG